VLQRYIREHLTGTWLLKDVTVLVEYYRECEEWKEFLKEIDYIEEAPGSTPVQQCGVV